MTIPLEWVYILGAFVLIAFGLYTLRRQRQPVSERESRAMGELRAQVALLQESASLLNHETGFSNNIRQSLEYLISEMQHFSGTAQMQATLMERQAKTILAQAERIAELEERLAKSEHMILSLRT
jgi:hypothetical protein